MRHALTPLIPTVGAVLALGASATAETARGVVFHDRNGDGARQPGEPGVAGVKVSNGLDIAVTDADGRYELPVDDDAIVFVIKPSGWMTRTDGRNVPRFSYVHKPAGSPDDGFLFEGVEPTGTLPGSIDFALTRRFEPDSFDVVLIADPQPYDLREVRWYARSLARRVAPTDAAFAVVLGDLVGDDLELFGPLDEAQASLGVPVYSVLGNHDINFMAPDDASSDETFERVYGPADYAFEVGKSAWIVLDNVEWLGFDGVRDDGFPNTGNYQGALSERQLRFVENYLETVPEDRLVVVCGHIPLYEREWPKHSVPQAFELMGLLSRFDRTLSLSGHMHEQSHTFVGSEGGYTPPTPGVSHHHYNLGTASGSWWRGAPEPDGIPSAMMRDGTPRGVSVLSVRGSDYRARFVPTTGPVDRQMWIEAPDTVRARDAWKTEVTVNPFGAMGRATVRLRVDDGPWVEMERSPRVCPTFARVKARDDAVRRAFVAAGEDAPSALPQSRVIPDIYAARLPDGLAPGARTIEVEVTDPLLAAPLRATRPIWVE